MSDDLTRREANNVRDNAGNVYDIKDGHAEAEIPNPRDSVGVEPAAGYMGGGAGGIATSGFTTTADTDEGELRSTSDSGPHGAVAESADLGQRPLRDYKREGDPSFDATDTTMSASQGSTGPVDSYVSDGDTVGDTVDRSVGDTSRGVSSATSGTLPGESMAGGSRASGTTIVDTSRDRLDDTSATIRGESGNDTGRDTTRSTATGGLGSDESAAPASTMRSNSMSLDNDNTSPLGDVSSTETLRNVREGMKVIDTSGDEIGKVSALRSGDTSSSTVDDAGGSDGGRGVIPIPAGTGTGGSTGTGAGAGVGAAGIFAAAGSGDDEPNVAEPAYSRLTRVGFIKIDAKGFFASDRYAGADQIDRVDGDTIYLSVGKDDLIS